MCRVIESKRTACVDIMQDVGEGSKQVTRTMMHRKISNILATNKNEISSKKVCFETFFFFFFRSEINDFFIFYFIGLDHALN